MPRLIELPNMLKVGHTERVAFIPLDLASEGHVIWETQL
jgi:hypothetical protein